MTTTTTTTTTASTATVTVTLTRTEAINVAVELRHQSKRLLELAHDLPKLAGQLERDADEYERIAATIDAAREAALS